MSHTRAGRDPAFRRGHQWPESGDPAGKVVFPAGLFLDPGETGLVERMPCLRALREGMDLAPGGRPRGRGVGAGSGVVMGGVWRWAWRSQSGFVSGGGY
jgi:hypothetical protein